MTPEQEIQQLRQSVAHLKNLTRAQVNQLKQEVAPDNPVQSVVAVRERTRGVLEVLPCLTERQGRAFLYGTETASGVRRRELLDLIVPFIDERYAEVRDGLAEIWLTSGRYGQMVIDAAIRDVNRLRRQRGAVELAGIDSLLQVMEHQARESGKEFDPEQFVAVAPEVLKAFQLEDGGTGVSVGGFGLKQLGWLREIKTVIKRDFPQLADPFRGSADAYYNQVAAMYQAAADRQLGPLTAERQHELKQQATSYPNTLFEDARGVRTWGGRWPNKKVQSTGYQSVPVQGPRRVSEGRVLTAYGERLLREYRERGVAIQLGFPSTAEQAQQHQRAIEAKRQELLSAEPDAKHGPTWRVNVALEELGFGTQEVQQKIDAPDKPYEQLFSGQSVAELIEQMAAAMKEMGHEAGQDAARWVP